MDGPTLRKIQFAGRSGPRRPTPTPRTRRAPTWARQRWHCPRSRRARRGMRSTSDQGGMNHGFPPFFQLEKAGAFASFTVPRFFLNIFQRVQPTGPSIEASPTFEVTWFQGLTRCFRKCGFGEQQLTTFMPRCRMDLIQPETPTLGKTSRAHTQFWSQRISNG